MDSTPKTVLRSVRLPHETERALEEEAAAQGESLNHRIASVLSDYAQYGRHAARFGHVSMSREFFRALLQAVDEPTLVAIAEDLGSRLPREISLFWFDRATPETFLQYIEIVGRHYRQAHTEVVRAGRTVTVKIRHELGPKYTTFLRHYLAAGARSLIGVAPETQVADGTLVLRFELR